MKPTRPNNCQAARLRMKIYWSLKQIPELSGLSWQERNRAFRRFRGYSLGARVSIWGVAAWLILISSISGGAFAAGRLSDTAGACVLAVCGIGGFYLHILITLNQMGRCIRSGEFRIYERVTH